MIRKAPKLGDTKIDKNGRKLYYVEYKPGKRDWRFKPQDFYNKKNGTKTATGVSSTVSKYKKLAQALKNKDDDELRRFAENENNDPGLRQLSYKELKERGVDVSDIDLNTGRIKKLKDATGANINEDVDLRYEGIKENIENRGDHFFFEDEAGNGYASKPDEDLEKFAERLANDKDVKVDVKKMMGDKMKKFLEKIGDTKNVDIDEDGNFLDMNGNIIPDDIDWQDPEWQRRAFGGLKTVKQRIKYDAFVDAKKRLNDELDPLSQIAEMNKTTYYFLKNKLPFMIISGGAGTGKSYNFRMIAKQGLGMRGFDPEKDQPGDEDYDFVEVGEVTSDRQFVDVLKKHNGKVILFDDTDALLTKSEIFGLLKKATSADGKRMVGKENVGNAFEFTGQIIILTNKQRGALTKNDDLKAIYSRATKTDIYFTKREMLEFMESLKYKFDFEGIERLDDPLEDKKERDEVFKVILEHYEDIDPAKFSTRLFRDAIAVKRENDESSELAQLDSELADMLFPGRAVVDWKEALVRKLLKGSQVSFKNIFKIGKNEKIDTLQKAEKYFKLS